MKWWRRFEIHVGKCLKTLVFFLNFKYDNLIGYPKDTISHGSYLSWIRPRLEPFHLEEPHMFSRIITTFPAHLEVNSLSLPLFPHPWFQNSSTSIYNSNYSTLYFPTYGLRLSLTCFLHMPLSFFLSLSWWSLCVAQQNSTLREIKSTSTKFASHPSDTYTLS